MSGNRSVRAVILAAGVGRRLGVADGRPKSLLAFGGRSLLARHIELLVAQEVDSISIGVGYEAAQIEAEINRLAPPVTVRTVPNPRFREGSIVTLWTLRDELAWGGDVLVMDADVLYDSRMLDALGNAGSSDAILSDSGFEPGDEPVKLCRRGGRIVEFGKIIRAEFDAWGESVGFFRFSAATARALCTILDGYIADGRVEEAYEEAIRDLLLGPHGERFAVADVTGHPWIEIDFPEDVGRAERDVLPWLAD